MHHKYHTLSGILLTHIKSMTFNEFGFVIIFWRSLLSLSPFSLLCVFFFRKRLNTGGILRMSHLIELVRVRSNYLIRLRVYFMILCTECGHVESRYPFFSNMCHASGLLIINFVYNFNFNFFFF